VLFHSLFNDLITASLKQRKGAIEQKHFSFEKEKISGIFLHIPESDCLHLSDDLSFRLFIMYVFLNAALFVRVSVLF
jgi:hypothetical protein